MPAPVVKEQQVARRDLEDPIFERQPQAARDELDLNVFADCAQIGTDVRFLKNPPEAFLRARAEKKLVFVVHLAGNFEDKDFT